MSHTRHGVYLSALYIKIFNSTTNITWFSWEFFRSCRQLRVSVLLLPQPSRRRRSRLVRRERRPQGWREDGRPLVQARHRPAHVTRLMSDQLELSWNSFQLVAQCWGIKQLFLDSENYFLWHFFLIFIHRSFPVPELTLIWFVRSRYYPVMKHPS